MCQKMLHMLGNAASLNELIKTNKIKPGKKISVQLILSHKNVSNFATCAEMNYKTNIILNCGEHVVCAKHYMLTKKTSVIH